MGWEDLRLHPARARKKELFLSILQALESDWRNKHWVPEHREARGGAGEQPSLLELRIVLRADTS